MSWFDIQSFFVVQNEREEVLRLNGNSSTSSSSLHTHTKAFGRNNNIDEFSEIEANISVQICQSKNGKHCTVHAPTHGYWTQLDSVVFRLFFYSSNFLIRMLHSGLDCMFDYICLLFWFLVSRDAIIRYTFIFIYTDVTRTHIHNHKWLYLYLLISIEFTHSLARSRSHSLFIVHIFHFGFNKIYYEFSNWIILRFYFLSFFLFLVLVWMLLLCWINFNLFWYVMPKAYAGSTYVGAKSTIK